MSGTQKFPYQGVIDADGHVKVLGENVKQMYGL